MAERVGLEISEDREADGRAPPQTVGMGAAALAGSTNNPCLHSGPKHGVVGARMVRVGREWDGPTNVCRCDSDSRRRKHPDKNTTSLSQT